MQLASLHLWLTASSALAANIGHVAQGNSMRFQWPWSTKSKEDMPFPGSSSFDPDISSMSPICLWSAWTASSKFNTTCFENSRSLYFSAPSQICSEKCLDTTIQLSQYLVERCGLDSSLKDNEPVGYNHKNVVYLSWANRDLARLVCNGASGKSDPGRCYSTIFAAESIRESGMISNGEADKSNVCNDCTHEWAKALKTSKHRVSPLLYYGHIPDAARLASWISELCDYQLTPF